ncbi:MAG TPA: hypothetical protein VFS17_00125 [Methylophilaceae bacterium]|nr:hypothetical protein [Methylophilaceae bacterium]
MSASLPAFAQNSATPDAQAPAAQQGGMMMHGGMQGGMMQGMGPMMGQHMMNVTVTDVDIKTGLVDASAGSMALRLHFPPPSLAGVKAGDKLSVHLAFHKQ